MTTRPLSPHSRGTSSGRSAENPPAASEKKFCKARPLADRLGVSVKTIFRWADSGHIARHKVNARIVLFDDAEVIAFIERCRVG